MYENLTIVMPAYNASAYIEDALASLLPATGVQVIVIDDGSTDDTVARVNYFVEKTKLPVTVMAGNHRGASAARNLGMTAVTTEYVMFLDADDMLDFSDCESLPAFMADNSVDVISIGAIHETMTVDMTRKRRLNILIGLLGIDEDLGDTKTMHERFSCAGPVSKLYRMAFLREHAIQFPEDIANGEDVLFNVAVLSYAERVGYYEASLYRYRYNGESVSKKVRYSVADNHIKFTTAFRGLAEGLLNNPAEMNGLLASCFVNDYVTCLMKDLPRNDRMRIRQHAKQLADIDWQLVTKKKRLMMRLINWRLDAVVKLLMAVKRFKLHQPTAAEFLHY